MGTIMLGNFMRECGVVARLTKASENEIANIVHPVSGPGDRRHHGGPCLPEAANADDLGMGFIAICMDTVAGSCSARSYAN